MEFGLSSEQTLLQESVGRFLDSKGSLERVQRFIGDGEKRADDVWGGLTELGVTAMLVGEAHGGLGMGMLDAALVAETLGSRVAPVAFLGSAVLGPLAVAKASSEEQQARWLPKMAEGSVTIGVAISEAVSSREGAGVEGDGKTLNGRSLFVLDFEADAYLVADGAGRLYLVEADAAGLERNALTTVDRTRWYGELVFDQVAAEMLPGSEDGEVCREIIDAGRVMLAAETLGAAQAMLDKSVAYSKERVQFGRMIGSFQAVKHMCAEMAAALEPCRSMVWYAAHAIDAVPDEARLTACHAKAHVAEVGTVVARTSTEVHGGIGFTDELGLHLWFKRIGANRQMWGGPTQVREEAARLQGLV